MHPVIRMNLILGGFSAFRLFAYILNMKMVTKAKINEKDWDNAKVQELAYRWTETVRLWSITRVSAYLSVILAADVTTNRYFLWTNLGIDVYELSDMIHNYYAQSVNGTVVKYRKLKIPICIQNTLVLSSLACVVYDHFYN
eukprot:226802_1